jgi:hypothetical protein
MSSTVEMTTTQFNLSSLKLRVQLLTDECGVREDYTQEFLEEPDSELDASTPDFRIVGGGDLDDKWEPWLKVSL